MFCWPLPQPRLPVSAAGGGRLRCKQLQIHHALLSSAAHICKADILRVAFGQQHKAGFGQLKGTAHPFFAGRIHAHCQTRAVRLIKGFAVGVLFPGQQVHKALHHGAGSCTNDVLPGRRIACMTGSFQPAAQPGGGIHLAVTNFHHKIHLLFNGCSWHVQRRPPAGHCQGPPALPPARPSAQTHRLHCGPVRQARCPAGRSPLPSVPSAAAS